MSGKGAMWQHPADEMSERASNLAHFCVQSKWIRLWLVPTCESMGRKTKAEKDIRGCSAGRCLNEELVILTTICSTRLRRNSAGIETTRPSEKERRTVLPEERLAWCRRSEL